MSNPPDRMRIKCRQKMQLGIMFSHDDVFSLSLFYNNNMIYLIGRSLKYVINHSIQYNIYAIWIWQLCRIHHQYYQISQSMHVCIL